MSPATRQIPSETPTKRFHAASLRTGSFEFLPVPFLDEWLIKRQRREIVTAILKQRGISFDENVPSLIAGGSRSLFSRLGSLTRGLILKPLRKVLRTAFFWLAAKSAARTAMTTYFLARFLHHPGLLPPNQPTHLTSDRARQLQRLFDELAKGIDLRAAKDAFGRVSKLFARSDQTSGGEISTTIEKSAPGFIQHFDAMVHERLLALDEKTDA